MLEEALWVDLVYRFYRLRARRITKQNPHTRGLVS